MTASARTFVRRWVPNSERPSLLMEPSVWRVSRVRQVERMEGISPFSCGSVGLEGVEEESERSDSSSASKVMWGKERIRRSTWVMPS